MRVRFQIKIPDNTQAVSVAVTLDSIRVPAYYDFSKKN